jgi:phosphoribosylformylglycinamidine synthase
MRDVFTMGARPVANLNALRFGSPDHPKTRHLVAGVVAGIGDYGNCIGVPTVGGEMNFDSNYDNNILVNAMCVGIAPTDRIFYSAATGVGNPVVYVGSKTGRDGIHGATMASAEFDDASAEKRPTVQVGDPFAEKLLLEACLELMSEDAIIAIQDMGAAGLTSSSVEMASKGKVGLELNLDRVPQREENMTAYEMLLSESQERMLMVLRPGSEAKAEAIFCKWDLDFAIVGVTTDTRRLFVKHRGVIEADIPIPALADNAPEYERPIAKRSSPAPVSAKDVPAPSGLREALMALIASPNLCSRRWIWEQYDHMVMTDTVQRPGADAAVVRIHGTNKGLAMTCDVTPRYCAADPFEGGKQAIAEAWRNLTASGAKPLAVTDCMNFANPERPEVMGEFASCIEGMAAACKALEFPVVSGNVSLYNETNGVGIMPTPSIGAIGLIPDVERMGRINTLHAGDAIFLVGDDGKASHLGQSLYQNLATGAFAGTPPSVDLSAERRHGDFVRYLIKRGITSCVHDISDGGLFVALAEMALASDIGIVIGKFRSPLPLYVQAFAENQGRYLVTVSGNDYHYLTGRLSEEKIPFFYVGRANGVHFEIPNEEPIPLTMLRAAHEGWFPGYMNR